MTETITTQVIFGQFHSIMSRLIQTGNRTEIREKIQEENADFSHVFPSPIQRAAIRTATPLVT
jgi:hypothetical protein